MRSHRGRDRFRIACDKVDDFRQRPITIGIAARIGESGQPALPLGREQPQRVPSLGTPALRDFAALQQDMVDRTLREAAAHRKSRVPRTDNDGGDSAHRAVSAR